MEKNHLSISKIDVEKHLDELFALDVKVADATPSLLPLENKEKFLEFLIKEHKSDTYILEDKAGAYIGYLSVIDKPKENAMEILNLGVDPDLQGNGYGKHMMEFAEKLAKDLGRRKTTLVTNTKNTQAIDFYKGIGYNIVKEIEDYYGDGETRYLFEKTLV